MVEQLTIWRALNAALRDALSEDDRVLLMGEDLTRWATGGGIYGVTKRLADEFGAHRVRDTPISEEAIVAAGVGAAIQGCRPVVEIMYSDFSLLAMDPIINQAAKIHYMFGGQFHVPLVIRSNGGSGIGKAAQHSQSLETLFAHIPVWMSHPGNSERRLRAATRGHPQSEPDHLPRTQGAVQHSRTISAKRSPWMQPNCPRRKRPHHRRHSTHAAPRASRSGRAFGHRHQYRGYRSAHSVPA